jgi:hypothetical protein
LVFDRDRPTIQKVELLWPEEENSLFQYWTSQRFK